jgi:hypothetical protein
MIELLARLRLSGSVAVGSVLLATGCADDAARQPYVPPLVVTSEVDVAGCYEVAALVWDTPPPGLQHLAEDPPTTFFLSPEFHPLGRRAIMSAGNESQHQYTGWRLAEGPTLEATWRAAAGTVRISVKRERRDPAVWVGTATRLAGYSSWEGRVRLRHISGGRCAE